ncbi:MAG: hypothetical protein A2275_06930 [Bacteroidetes bacterium RIFOXYA12_FULL_35_11]|nr:MAG: hypothetical protein A2X01_01245 [Bacteroidetes bacterium GWF2_35_48]OFY83168.1 MAG: hypothetical protein A2275_06930 [Bacteroidetes bacterium RIFOXYA12_FULL_35_11]OFY97344.1 MAG: hypothetical protein A2491_21165 [Bacteroidetes bacterium RIFOXYC12_FULL_35_7]HBX51202.1 hypothetical protein [Bacteroidales bacterium]
MLTINKLCVAYEKNLVLENLDLILDSGLIHGLVGLNGSGKTTLLNCFFQFVKPVSGEILLDNKKIQRKDISFLETGNYFYPGITGKEYLKIFPKQNEKFKIEEWQELFQLPLNELIENYSTGMKKKLAIFALMKQDKKMLMLDEPFNGLDIETVQILKNILSRMKQNGKTIIITSHIFESLESVCDKIYRLENKKITGTYAKTEFDILKHTMYESIREKTEHLIEKIM